MMDTADVIVVGAGASGLLAARLLAENGISVIVIEAADRIGGRMHTLTDGFARPVEGGAEFVHGNLPLSLSLLQEAGIDHPVFGMKFLCVENGRIMAEEEPVAHWDELVEKLDALRVDIPLRLFLDHYFSEPKYDKLRKSAEDFASGYDTANPDLVSTLALKAEWLAEEEEQYRVGGGYGRLADFLAGKIVAHGGSIVTGQPVTAIRWSAGEVGISTIGREFSSRLVLITLPVPLMSHPSIRFEPQITAIHRAYADIGYGEVTKFLLEFDEPFWEQKTGESDDPVFILSDEPVRTWWTQSHGDPLLTGWVGGPASRAFSALNDDDRLAIALRSLSAIFAERVDELKRRLRNHRIINWESEDTARGSYAYALPETPAAREFIAKGVENTLFFAGEALYTGKLMGTVEAALQSGRESAETIMRTFSGPRYTGSGPA